MVVTVQADSPSLIMNLMALLQRRLLATETITVRYIPSLIGPFLT